MELVFHPNIAITTVAVSLLVLLQPSLSSVAPSNEPFCGGSTTRITKRIVGGGKASECEYPWMVVVLVGGGQCGGSIIDQRHILTAAHCLEGGDVTPETPVKILIGSSRLDEMTEVEVKSWKLHPLRDTSFKVDIKAPNHPWSYRVDPFYIKDIDSDKVNGRSPDSIKMRRTDKDYDVAMLTLAEPLEYTDCVSPICLPTLENKPDMHDECVAAGWGNDLKNRMTFTQKKVTLPLVSFSNCEEAYREILDETKFCAGDLVNGGVDTCQGDSGGPLMCRSQDGQFIQYGIVSFGRKGCGVPFEPGVYTRVNHPVILDFILDAMQDV